MYIEKRKVGKSIKYYLVHSYREKDKVEKIRKYLGINLSESELEKRKEETTKVISELLEDINTKIFSFTLSKKQVELLNNYNNKIRILHKEIVENSEEIETQGVANAINYLRDTKEELSLNLLLKLHELCFKGSKPFAGKFREVNVVVRNSIGQVLHAGVPKEELEDYLKDFINWYKNNKNKFKPLVLAAIIHNQFEHIHPFQDGNGRVGRLLLNYILLKRGYPPINIKLEDRQEYYKTLQEYSKNDNLKPTLKFLIKQYKKTLKEVSTKSKNY